MSAFLSALLAIFKAVPTLKTWWDQLLTMYVKHSINEMHEADKEALRKALNEHDQRDLETQLGSTISGEASGAPGTELRDTLPGVQAETGGDTSSPVVEQPPSDAKPVL